MVRRTIGIVDFGVGNLKSVTSAIHKCGANSFCSSDPEKLLGADSIILPGVGAFRNAMTELKIRGLDELVVEVAARGTPLLGICLGMQLLFEESSEFGNTKGLGLLQGSVVEITAQASGTDEVKVPHIGWNELIPNEANQWDSTLLASLRPNTEVYFVHSYVTNPVEKSQTIAEAKHQGVTFPAYVAKKNISGCQFHPEKSGNVGLKIISNFVRLD